MVRDNSPNALKWARRKGACAEALEWIASLGPNATCQEAWLKCQKSSWLEWTLGCLKTRNNYQDAIDWFWEWGWYNGPIFPSANVFRKKCAELGCYGKGKRK